MIDVPKPGSHFYGAYEIALDWCDDAPQGKKHDDCVVGAIASLSARQQVAADRATLAEGAVVFAVFAGVAVIVARRFRRS